LRRADLKMTPFEYLVVWAAIFGISIPLGFIVSGLGGGVIALLLIMLAGAIGPWFYLGRRAKKRRRAFIEQLADMAQMMGNSMRAGFSIIQSMELVGREASKPASDEFERVVTEVKLGLQVDVALDHLLERMPSEDLELMVVAINVQRQIGGNLSEILAVISHTIRERVRFERDLRALTAQARYSSYIITGLPVAVAIVINFMDREYESYLYSATLGHVMLGTAVCMLIAGFFFLNKIANIEV
jgi:tight adherence protein B